MLYTRSTLMHCGIQSVSPSLVYYIWIIIPTLSLIHHSKFVDFLIISLLTLSLPAKNGTSYGYCSFVEEKKAFCRRLTTTLTSLKLIATLKKWLKDFSLRTRYQTPEPWISTASELRHIGSIWMSRILPKWACWPTTEMGLWRSVRYTRKKAEQTLG